MSSTNTYPRTGVSPFVEGAIVLLAPLKGTRLHPRTILIIEDVKSTLAWLVSIVSEVFPAAAVATAETLAAARDACNQNDFDLLLLDLGMPDGSGLDLIRSLRKSSADSPYIVVTTIFDEDEFVRSALRLGANGYLLKDDAREDMVRNLRNLTQSRPPVSTRALNRILGHYQPDTADMIALTAREEDVLRFIAKGYNVSETADMLNLTSNTVKGYLKTVYSKLNISTRAEATAEAIRRNLVNTHES